MLRWCSNFALLAALLAAAIPFGKLSAHGLETEQIQVVGEHTVEFAYASYAVRADEPSQFNLRLFLESSGKPVEFDYAFLQFRNEENTRVAVARLDPDSLEVNSVRLLAVMPTAGSYSADAAFYRDDAIIAEASFDFPVDPPWAGKRSWRDLLGTYGWLLALAGGLALGWAGGEMLRRRK